MRKGLHLIYYVRIAVFITAMTMLTSACTTDGTGNTDEAKQHKEQQTDTLHTELKAMAVYDYQPERALQIVDSAEAVGNLSEFWADLIRMKIFGQTLIGDVADSLVAVRADVPQKHNMRYESVIYIGERLLVSDSCRASLALQENVLEVMVNAARQLGQTEQAITFARQLVDVCHLQGAETEALRNEAEIGALLCAKGQKKLGFSKLDSVLALLDLQRRFNQLDALIIASKRKMDVLAGEDRYLEILPLAQRIIDRLDDYERHPETYHDGTYREPLDSADRADYIQFYRSQAQGLMTAAYAVLGQQQSMEDVYQQIERTVRNATAREHIARYQTLEHQMLRHEAESRSRLMSILGGGACVGLIIILLVTTFIYYQNRRIKQRNHALVRQIDEAIAFKEKYLALKEDTLKEQQAQTTTQSGDLDQLTDTDLFRYLSDVILRERLFLDPLYNREKLCQRFGLSEHQVGAAFSRGSSFGSLPAFVRDLRLEHACLLLREHADMPVGEVAHQSGFSNHRSFSTEFKRHFGLSPSEYRQQ